MKYIIIFNLLVISIINPIIGAHENHDHHIYSWSYSKNKTIKKDPNFNVEKLEDKENKANSNWLKIFRK